MKDRVELIADLLMGAAYADRHLEQRELEKVKKLLAELTGKSALSAQLEDRLSRFEPNKLDVRLTVDELDLKSDLEKRKLLELITAVHDADEIWDFDEDLYLRGVAAALGVPDADISDLTVGELQIDVIGEALLPPPLPKKSIPPPLPKS